MSDNNCPFCNLDRIPITVTNTMLLIESKFPVAENGHYLIIPREHIKSCFDFNKEEWLDLRTLMNFIKDKMIMERAYFDFNGGFNDGELAGQTVMHAHFHIIGRKKGDVENPRGGIRNIIPSKGDYLK